MRARLLECGVRPERITIRRDNSPVKIEADTPPLARPAELAGKYALLYSGNWGVAHEIDTFFEGYRLHHQVGRGSVVLWLMRPGRSRCDRSAAP